MQAGFISAARWEIRDLAIWLVRRAVQVGSKEAIANLEEYSQATQFPAQVVHCLTGLKVETAVDIAPIISLVPWQEVPDAREKNTLFAKLGTYHMGVPSAALLKKVLFPKLHAPDTGNFLVQLDESDLRDACFA
jgi:hypothetical protein